MKKIILLLLVFSLLLYATSCTVENSEDNSNGEVSSINMTPVYPDPPEGPVILEDYYNRKDEYGEDTEYLFPETNKVLKRASDDDMDQLITKTYPEQELIQFFRFGHISDNNNSSLDEAEEQYPPECIRRPENGMVYCIYKTDQNGYFYLFFTKISGYYLARQGFLIQEPLSQSDFASIQPGSALEDVLTVDKGFAALYGKEETPNFIKSRKSSIHLTREGLVYLEYDISNSNRFVTTSKELKSGMDTILSLDFRILEKDMPK